MLTVRDNTKVHKIFKVIQRKALEGIHLPVTVKEIQARYLNSLSVCLYLYLVPSLKAAIRRTEILAERYLLPDSLLFRLHTTPGQEAVISAIPENA